jgi:hypothetical protein
MISSRDLTTLILYIVCHLWKLIVIYVKIKLISSEFKLCLDCYLISSGRVKSTFTIKPILIFYLP